MSALRYAVVVSVRDGYAGLFVDRVAGLHRDGEPGGHRAVLAAVIHCRGEYDDPARRRRMRRRRIRKALRIGIIGSLNGLRMRRWYGAGLAARLGAPDIIELCRRRRVPLISIARFDDPAAQAEVRALGLDLAVSMGNGYIPRSFFTVPRLGMINVHHEMLPRYRGAQTALWQLHDGSDTTGFSIHEITERIDAGRLLHTEAVPIVVRPTLRDTVIETSSAVQLRSIDALVGLVESFEEARARALPNAGGASYTTPGTGALLRIYRNWHRLRRAATTPEP